MLNCMVSGAISNLVWDPHRRSKPMKHSGQSRRSTNKPLSPRPRHRGVGQRGGSFPPHLHLIVPARINTIVCKHARATAF